MNKILEVCQEKVMYGGCGRVRFRQYIPSADPPLQREALSQLYVFKVLIVVLEFSIHVRLLVSINFDTFKN